MTACDTSVFISERVGDCHQERARSLIDSTEHPIMISRLNQLEFTTVVCRLEGEGKLSAAQAKGILQTFEEHVLGGMLQLVEVDDKAVWARAMGLARHHAASLGVRTLDIWQVAIAIEMGARTFWSFDGKQRKLAEAVGFEVNP